MFGVKKLLVGVDLVPSPNNPDEYELPQPTREAVETALQVGEFSKVKVTFLGVTEPPPEGSAMLTAVQSQLDALVSEATERGVTAEARVATGRAWMEIIREVIRNGHQLLIVGSRNTSIASRLWVGSTGTKLLRKCPCPVWVARPDDDREEQTIIVADDLTEVGEHCLQIGVSAARLLDARLLVLHVVQYPLEHQLRRSGTPPEEIVDYKETTAKEAEQQLHERLAQTDCRTISAGVRVEVVSGLADVAIQDAIEEHSAHLLVMGTVARGGIPGLLVGNTAERLLPSLTCSVIAVKPEGFVCPVQLD